MLRLSPRAGALVYGARADVAAGAGWREQLCTPWGAGGEDLGDVFLPTAVLQRTWDGKGEFAARSATRKGSVYTIISKANGAWADRLRLRSHWLRRFLACLSGKAEKEFLFVV